MFKGVKAWAPLAIAVIALFAALGGVGWAAGLVSGKTIKPGSIPLNRLTKSARGALAGQPGPAGPAGPRGPEGPQGPKGDTGTVDASQYYDKTQSDSLYLGVGASAANAERLGGNPASDYVRSQQGNTANSIAQNTVTLGAGSATDLLVARLGKIHVACANPAAATLTFVPSAAGTDVVITRAASAATYAETTTSPLSVFNTPSAAGAAGESMVQATTAPSAGRPVITDTFTLTAVTAPQGGNNQCLATGEIVESAR